MRSTGRTDSNHKSIVYELRKIGAEVQSLADIGKGCADALVAFRGSWYVAEIKDGSLPPSRRALTDAEIAWHERFGSKAPVHIWNSLEEALQTIGASRT